MTSDDIIDRLLAKRSSPARVGAGVPGRAAAEWR